MNHSSIIANLTATDQYMSHDEFTTKFHDLLAVLSFFICVSGFVGNFTIANVIWRRKKIQSPTNWLVFNLSICNLFIVVFIIPYNTTLPFTDWLFGDTGCKYAVRPVVEHFTAVCVLTYTAISIARYSAICNVENRGGIKTKKAVVIIVFIWVVSFLVVSASLMGFLGQYNITYANGRSHCWITWKSDRSRHIYRVTVFLLSYLIPMLISGYTCGKIYYIVLQGLKKIIFIIPVDMLLLRQKKSRQVGFRLLIIFLIMFLTASPLQLFLLLQDFQVLPSFKAHNFVLHLLMVLFYLQSTTTPFLLLCMGDEYRKEVTRLYTGWCMTFPRLNELFGTCKIYSRKIFEKHTIFTESRSESYSVEQWVIAGKYVTTIIPTTHGERTRPYTECTDVSLISYSEVPQDSGFRRSRSHTECTDLSVYDNYDNYDNYANYANYPKNWCSERIHCEPRRKELYNEDNSHRTLVFLEDEETTIYNEDSNYELFRTTSNCRKRASFSSKETDSLLKYDIRKRDSLTTAFINFNKTNDKVLEYSKLPSEETFVEDSRESTEEDLYNSQSSLSRYSDQSTQTEKYIKRTNSKGSDVVVDMPKFHNETKTMNSKTNLDVNSDVNSDVKKKLRVPKCVANMVRQITPLLVANDKRDGVIYDEDDVKFQYVMEVLGDVGRETYI